MRAPVSLPWPIGCPECELGQPTGTVGIEVFPYSLCPSAGQSDSSSLFVYSLSRFPDF